MIWRSLICEDILCLVHTEIPTVHVASFLLALLVVLFLLVHFLLPVRLVLTLLVLLTRVILVGFLYICSSLFDSLAVLADPVHLVFACSLCSSCCN